MPRYTKQNPTCDACGRDLPADADGKSLLLDVGETRRRRFWACRANPDGEDCAAILTVWASERAARMRARS